MAFTNKDYKGPKTTEYLRYKEVGKHMFRLMGDIHPYNRYWKNKKPYMYTEEAEIPADADKNDKGKTKLDHVWAVIAVRKDEAGKATVCGPLEIPHTGVQKSLMDYYNDADYGDFTLYDIVITREGSGRYDTKYSVMPKPPKAPAKDALALYEEYEPKDLAATTYSKEQYSAKGDGEATTNMETADLDEIAVGVEKEMEDKLPDVDFDKIDMPKEETK